MTTRRLLAPTDVDLVAYDAFLFDLDGVITRTASVHARAWKTLFDTFLAEWAKSHDEPFVAFDASREYGLYVDGRRRYDGVDTFLRARGIELAWGSSSDPVDAPTVCGLGNRKDQYFRAALERGGVEVFDDTVSLARTLSLVGKRLAVVSASENCLAVLDRAGLLDLFPVRITGVDAARLGLAGKPAPDTFLEAAERLGVGPPDAVVFEDALAGVEAGAAGGFGLVVGVDRVGAATELARHGADVVVADLSLLAPRR